MSDTQGLLFDPKPLLPSPALPREERARLNRQAEAVLARLRRGPATNVELNEIAFRYSARIEELRKAGHRIEREPVAGQKGVNRYRLAGEGETP